MGRSNYSSRRSKLRQAMMAAVTPRDVYEIVKLQVFLARHGDPMAVREVLDRTVGRAEEVVRVDLSATELLPDADEEARAMDGTVPALPLSRCAGIAATAGELAGRLLRPSPPA